MWIEVEDDDLCQPPYDARGHEIKLSHEPEENADPDDFVDEGTAESDNPGADLI